MGPGHGGALSRWALSGEALGRGTKGTAPPPPLPQRPPGGGQLRVALDQRRLDVATGEPAEAVVPLGEAGHRRARTVQAHLDLGEVDAAALARAGVEPVSGQPRAYGFRGR